MALIDAMPLPTQEDRELARSSLKTLSSLGNRQIQIQLDDPKSTCTLPIGVVRLLLEVLDCVAEGQGAAVVPLDDELTTQQAAEILGVSRPYIIKLLDNGVIPCRMVGTHRRVQMKDVLEFQEETNKKRLLTLDQLTEEAEKLGMGY